MGALADSLSFQTAGLTGISDTPNVPYCTHAVRQSCSWLRGGDPFGPRRARTPSSTPRAIATAIQIAGASDQASATSVGWSPSRGTNVLSTERRGVPSLRLGTRKPSYGFYFSEMWTVTLNGRTGLSSSAIWSESGHLISTPCSVPAAQLPRGHATKLAVPTWRASRWNRPFALSPRSRESRERG